MNWGFVVLYVTCRLSPNFGSARSAMWLSATVMSFLNVPLFFLAPEMVSNVFDAGQGIGVIQAMLSMPLWFGPYPDFLDPDSGIGRLVFAPLAPIPFLGLIGWIAGRFIGWPPSSPKGKLRGRNAPEVLVAAGLVRPHVALLRPPSMSAFTLLPGPGVIVSERPAL